MIDLLTGKTESHLVPFGPENRLVNAGIVQRLAELFAAASQDGFELRIASSYRSFERQRAIWNDKIEGRRPVLDHAGRALELARLSPREIVFAILRWSALPGASRHHWGTDFDFYDAAAITIDYRLKLTPDEYAAGGPFSAASEWLDLNLERHGFFRPYEKDAGGVAPEPWHVSHRALSGALSSAYTREIFAQHLASSEFAFIEVVRTHADEIYRRFLAPIG